MKLRFWEGDDEDETGEKIKLHKVEWKEEVERTREIETVRLVWSGGAERKVTHCPDMYHYHGMSRTEYVDVEGELVLEIDEPPAYREVISSDEVTRTETKRCTSWMDSVVDLPEGVERTGATRYVTPTEAPDHD